MKIFILNPLLFTGKLSKLSRKRQPLCLAYIASLLREKHEIELLDANALDLGQGETMDRIKNFAPEVLILTSTPVDRWEVPSHAHIKFLVSSMVEIINRAKVKYVILIGSHGSIMPGWILKKSRVDFVVRGEPELTVLKLIEALAEKKDTKDIKGISYLKNNQLVNNPDAGRNQELDRLPFPAYDLLPMGKYCYTFQDIPQPFSLMISSRGCPFHCTYCLKAMMPDSYIVRSPENVVTEMEHLSNQFGIKGIYFQDWEFMIDKTRVIRICDLIIEKKLDIKWGCNGRAPLLSDELVGKMRKAGCVRINIGFESGSQKVLDLAKKQLKISSVRQAVEACRKHDVIIGLYSILNLPGETRRTIKETERFLAENHLTTLCSPNLPIPYFSTELYEMLKKQEGKDFSWENLERYAGRVGVGQPPWLARIYHWHYKYKYGLGSFYFLKPQLYLRAIKLIRSKLPI